MYQIGQPILVPAVATDDQPGPVVFLAVTKKFDIATQNLQVPPAMQKEKKPVVNSNHSNYTTENYLHIASMMIILHNEYLMPCIRLWCIGSCISHVLDFVSTMFDEGHVMLTVQLTLQYLQ